MGTFNTKALLQASPELIPAIADAICRDFENDGFQVKRDDLYNGGCDISVTKGNLFKAVVGMKTALKISLTVTPDERIQFEAGIGIFGQQEIPALIMWFVAWPVLLTQIWGMVQQSKLDDRALRIAREVIAANPGYANPNPYQAPTAEQNLFCSSCGAKLPAGSKFCSHCGAKL